MPSPRFLTPADVAEVLNVSVRQVYALLTREELRGIQVGGKGAWRIESSALEDYIAAAYARSGHARTTATTSLVSDEVAPD